MLRQLGFIALNWFSLHTIAQIPAPDDYLLVCNYAEDTLSIITIAGQKEIALLPTASGPCEVAVSPNGRIAVVANYGKARAGHTLTVVDVDQLLVLRTIDLHKSTHSPDQSSAQPPRPIDAAFTAEDTVVIACEGSTQLLSLNLNTMSIGCSWSTDQLQPHMVSVAYQHNYAAFSIPDKGSIALIDLAKNEDNLFTRISTGKGAMGIAAHPGQPNFWVCNRLANTVSVVSLTKQSVSAILDTGAMPTSIAFTPDGKIALIACTVSGDLQVFESSSRKLLFEVSIHGDRSEQSSLPIRAVSGPDSTRAYVTCARGEFVAVIDLKLGQLIDQIRTRKGPRGIAVSRRKLNRLETGR